jgi:hypothetical protein
MGEVHECAQMKVEVKQREQILVTARVLGDSHFPNSWIKLDKSLNSASNCTVVMC